MMRNACILLLGSVLPLTIVCECAMADKRQGHRNQNQLGFQGGNGRQLAGGVGAANAAQMQAAQMQAAQVQAAQIAQVMLAGFDQDGDAALNLVELRAGLTALFQRMSAGNVRVPRLGLGGNQARVQPEADVQALDGGAAVGPAMRGGGGRRGGRK